MGLIKTTVGSCSVFVKWAQSYQNKPECVKIRDFLQSLHPSTVLSSLLRQMSGCITDKNCQRGDTVIILGWVVQTTRFSLRMLLNQAFEQSGAVVRSHRNQTVAQSDRRHVVFFFLCFLNVSAGRQRTRRGHTQSAIMSYKARARATLYWSSLGFVSKCQAERQTVTSHWAKVRGGLIALYLENNTGTTKENKRSGWGRFRGSGSRLEGGWMDLWKPVSSQCPGNHLRCFSTRVSSGFHVLSFLLPQSFDIRPLNSKDKY